MNIGRIIINPTDTKIEPETQESINSRKRLIRNHLFLKSIGLELETTGSIVVPYCAENEKYILRVSDWDIYHVYLVGTNKSFSFAIGEVNLNKKVWNKMVISAKEPKKPKGKGITATYGENKTTYIDLLKKLND